jgi:hypothetical protein
MIVTIYRRVSLHRRRIGAYSISMIPTPRDVLPLIECTVSHLGKGLRLGIGFADGL